MGDYLHCVLADTSFYNPPNSNPLSRADTHVIDGKRLYAAVTRNNELSAIVDTLKNADRNTLQIKFFPLKSMNKHLSGKRVTKTVGRIVPLPDARNGQTAEFLSAMPEK
ncbi:hypothetical protein QSX22_002653 [Salmonella enterica]|nr:hypothetical protein [Salmonella enterica]ELQ3858273.1 hypothetical protein [Salmonella enterica]